jgi:predicted TPR repeat methyltransferase
VLARWPGQPDALHFLGILRHAQGRSDEGIALIRRALAAVPTEPGPWNNLGNVLVECQRLDEAAEAYRASIAVAKGRPASADAMNNLGTVLRQRLDWAGAERAYRDALALRPDFVDAWYNLSLVLMHLGRIPEGLIANSKAIALAPREVQARDQVIRALLLLGEREQAAVLYREWLAEEPDNPVVQHQLAACLGQATPGRASDAYVEQVFDSFARSFDAKLEKLHYRAPGLVADALQRAAGAPAAALDIVDAGCGTGLCGPLVRPWAKSLAGCDLSVGMLRQARPRGVYDRLHKAELVHYL